MQSDHTLLTGGLSTSSPGDIARALHDAFNVPAEAVGRLMRRSEGIWLELDAAHGQKILTPCPLALSGGARGVLRRPSDVPAAAPAHLLTMELGGARSAGALARALHEGSGISGEDIGPIRELPGGALETSLPRWRYRARDLPTELEGAPVRVEKKNSDALTPPSHRTAEPETGAEALAGLARLRPSAANLAAATRGVLARSRVSPELSGAVRRLAASGYSPPEPMPAPDPGLVVLTLATQSADDWRSLRKRLSTIPFPDPDHLTAVARLDALEKERRGELEPGDTDAPGLVERVLELATSSGGLETRALGTLCPGVDTRNVRSVPPGRDGDDLWSEWLRLAAALITSDGAEPAALRALDGRVRDAAAGAELAIGGWPALCRLVEAEIEGRGTPRWSSLESLPPDSARYEAAAVARIDGRVRHGRWAEAAGIAARGVSHHPHSAPLVRRLIRLTWRAEAAVDDDIALVLAAEAAWRSGKTDTAEKVFLAARPRPGTPAALHAAARLFERRRSAASWELLGPEVEENAELRLAAAVQTARWPEAVRAWAVVQGDALGLTPPPAWANEGVRAQLPEALLAVLGGELADAAEALAADGDDSQGRALATRCLAALEGRAVVPTPAACSVEEALALVFETPDARVPLRALGAALTDAQLSSELRPLALHLIREVPGDAWDARTVGAVAALAAAVESSTTDQLLRAIPSKILVQWLESRAAGVREAARNTLEHFANPPSDVAEALAAAPDHRLTQATTLLAANRAEEAAHVAHAVLRKAVTHAVRQACMETMLEAGVWSELEGLLRSAGRRGADVRLASELLRVLESRSVPAPLRADVEALLAPPAPARIRRAAAAALAV